MVNIKRPQMFKIKGRYKNSATREYWVRNHGKGFSTITLARQFKRRAEARTGGYAGFNPEYKIKKYGNLYYVYVNND
jgi:hypothetical protein